MSTNKFRYYSVVTEKIVKANNKTEAMLIADGHYSVPGEVVTEFQDANRITASEVHTLLAE